MSSEAARVAAAAAPAGPLSSRRAEAALVLAVVLVAFLPFVRGLAAGSTFYHRDLSRHFFPLRLFAVEGLRQGEVRFWNPYVHEGVPLLPLPISYPVDLLQALVPGHHGLSLVLALHVPLAAATFLALARGLGLTRAGAALGALVYALGGFLLSSLNLYIHVQAAAWAPLVALAVVRAASPSAGWRTVAFWAPAVALALSTTGVEIVGQALLVGGVLAFPRRSAAWARLGVMVVIAAALAAPVLFVVSEAIRGSMRDHGFTVANALNYSLHPVAFLQTIAAGVFGPAASLTDRFLGGRYTDGSPYFLSLYLGPSAALLAVAGAWWGRLPRRSLAVLGTIAVIVCLGRWVRLDLLLEALPALRAFRFPVKAFFSVHFVASLLAAAALDAWGSGAGGVGRALRTVLLAGGAAITLPALFALAVPAAARWLCAWLHPSTAGPALVPIGREVARDAALGGASAIVAGLVVAAVHAGRLRPALGAGAVVAVVAADLLRAGAGLNPMVPPASVAPAVETFAVARSVLAARGRLFVCEPLLSPSVLGPLDSPDRLPAPPGVWLARVVATTLAGSSNVPLGVPTAYGFELTGFVPVERAFWKRVELGCADVPAILDRLRAAGVSHVLSVAPLEAPGLIPRMAATPPSVWPLRTYLYQLDPPRPLRAVASRVVPRSTGIPGEVVVEGVSALEASGRVWTTIERTNRIELDVEADGPTVVVVRDAFAPGWRATVNGVAAPVLRADGRHRAVPIGAGRSRVVLLYRPPALVRGLAVGGVALLAVAWMLRGRWRPSARSTRNTA